MILLVFVLNQVEKLAPIFKRMEDAGFSGATALSSRGMGNILGKYFGGSLLGSLYAMIDPDQEESKTIFMVLKESDVESVITLIEAEIGSLDNPNSGIVFTVPVNFVKGIL